MARHLFLRQQGNTCDMIHPVGAVISYVSSVMTLEAGDVIITGTPEGVGPLVVGDTVTASIVGVTEITFSTVAAEPSVWCFGDVT